MKFKLLGWAAAICIALGLTACYDANDVQQACYGHGGVASTTSVAWDFSNDGDELLVVCKDGFVKGLD